MKVKFLAGWVLVGALAMPLGAYAQLLPDGDRSPPKQVVSGAMITAEIQAQFVRDPYVVAKDIRVETDANGVVQLSGTAKTQQELDRAAQIARSVRGVVAVDNRIQLSSNR